MPYSPDLPKINSRYTAAHADPQGQGDARPAALDIVEDEGLVGKLFDKVALVTGGTNGIGVEIVRALAKAGMTVFYTTRDVAKGQDVKKQLLGEDPNYKLEVVQIESSSLKSVKKAAEYFLGRAHRLDVLMLNGGVGAVPRAFTEDGFESQFAINYCLSQAKQYLSHFYLFNLVKDLLLETASTYNINVRVIATSSTAHTAPTVQPENNYDSHNPQGKGHPDAGQTYGHTHTAKIWLCNEIERLYGHKGTVEPVLREWLEKMIQMPHIQKLWMTVGQGAATNVIAAVGKDYDGLGGFYMENCRVSHLVPDDVVWAGEGVKSWAYDKEGEEKLWVDSMKMVGLVA
ncbi:short chain dehydrogenase [Diaporthe helianthi]|uniref:Short chain dehydrogenase n=1 Tax=Diaporthe helianthi TaxID=158607 RepID=A0A2P5HF68_DIAHE|nr:short chain dehydrogenase [Diaporthe helianthi]